MNDPYSLDELKKLDFKKLSEIKVILEKAIKETKKENKSKAIDEVQKLLGQMGLSLADVGLSKTQTKSEEAKKSTGAKYHNPDNAAETWSGRGRKPKWFKDALAAGATTESLEIPTQALVVA